MKDKELGNAFTEVYDILCHMEPEMYKKIPIKFIDTIKQNRNQEYEVKINYKKNIQEQEIMKDTKIILGIIYRDFLVDQSKKIELKKEDMKAIEKKYDITNLFKDTNSKANIQIPETNINNLPIKIKKESIFKRIVNKIKRIFRIK